MAAKTSFKKFLTFYARFTPSYSGIGYCWRRIFWRRNPLNFTGQTWLVAGGSQGIGGAAALAAANAGATVISVARGSEATEQLAGSVSGKGQIIARSYDLSLQRDVFALVEELQARGSQIDVVVNNVGIMLHKVSLTDEGFEKSFALSLLNHYLLTHALIERKLLSQDATVVEVSSGGMYNHPLVIDEMNNQTDSFEAKRAYGLNKRGQVVMTSYWREKFAGTGMNFYVMHPGWCDTAPVRRDMPTFHRILNPVLRTSAMGADTIVWLAARRPSQKENDSIWFDRKERDAHMYPRTRQSRYSKEDLIEFLESKRLSVQ